MADNSIMVGSGEILRQERCRPKSRLSSASDQNKFTGLDLTLSRTAC